MVIIPEGLSVGGTENKEPKIAKQSAESRMPAIRRTGWLSGALITPTAIAAGTSEKTTPNNEAATTSPQMSVGTVIGAARRRSSVRVRVSNGKTAGVVAEEVKNRAIAMRPGTRSRAGKPRPHAKAINRNAGKSTPKIMTGPRK